MCLHLLQKLNPCFFEGILCVGGRIDQAELLFLIKRFIILPRHHHCTRIAPDHNEIIGHTRMFDAWLSLRQKYGIVKGTDTVKKVLGQCL